MHSEGGSSSGPFEEMKEGAAQMGGPVEGTRHIAEGRPGSEVGSG